MAGYVADISLTDIVAFWGAFVATGLLIWNIIRERLDRGRLAVKGFIGTIHPDDSHTPYLFVKAVNTGRYPLKITGWGGRYKRKLGEIPRGFLIKPVAGEYPRILNVGEELQLRTDDLEVLTTEVAEIHVMDATDRAWKISRTNLRKILKDAESKRQRVRRERRHVP